MSRKCERSPDLTEFLLRVRTETEIKLFRSKIRSADLARCGFSFRKAQLALKDAEKTRYGLWVLFAGALLAVVWPVYPLFSRIRPFILGMPFSLFYLVLVLLICFIVLVGVYLWEDRRGELD